MRQVGKGYKSAMLELGLIYLKGESKQRDLQKAKYFFEQWEERGGSIDGYLLIASKYTRMEDYRQAAYWYEKAAEQGATYCCRVLGMIYEYGIHGVQKDLQRAIYYYKRALDSGEDVSNNLGDAYTEMKDYPTAIRYFSIKAQQGDEHSQFMLGNIYEKTGDYSKSVYWYTKAAEQDHCLAKKSL